jgi:hypothetical protein
MRTYAGTQDFIMSNDALASNITMKVYENDGCDNNVADETTAYSMTAGFCYPLYTDKPPRSFQWRSYPAKSLGEVGGAWRPPALQKHTAALTIAATAAVIGGYLPA